MDYRDALPSEIAMPQERLVTLQDRSAGHDEVVHQVTIEEAVQGMEGHSLGVVSGVDQGKSLPPPVQCGRGCPLVLGSMGIQKVELPSLQEATQIGSVAYGR